MDENAKISILGEFEARFSSVYGSLHFAAQDGGKEYGGLHKKAGGEFVGIPKGGRRALTGRVARRRGLGYNTLSRQESRREGDVLMKQFSYVLTNQDGLHTRPMSSLMREAARFSSRVRLKNGAKTALLAQMRDVMGLDMRCGSKVTVTVEGKDEEAAVAAIQNYFVDHL